MSRSTPPNPTPTYGPPLTAPQSTAHGDPHGGHDAEQAAFRFHTTGAGGPSSHEYALPPSQLSPDLGQTIIHNLQQIHSHQIRSDARLESALQTLSSEIKHARQVAVEYVQEIAEVLKTSHLTLLERFRRVEDILGMGAGMDSAEKGTLLSRFDLLSFDLEELMERFNANFPPIPPITRVYADIGVTARSPSSQAQGLVVAGLSPSVHESERSSSTLVVDEDPLYDKLSLQVKQPSNPLLGPQPLVGTPPALVPANYNDPVQPPVFSSHSGLQSHQLPEEDRAAPATPCHPTSVHPVSTSRSASPPPSLHEITPLLTTALKSTASIPKGGPALSAERSTISTTHTRHSSLGVPSLVRGATEPPPGPVSQSDTVEVEDVSSKSPSAETLGEELSIANMVSASPSLHSDPSSPSSLFSRFEEGASSYAIPSFITPSPPKPHAFPDFSVFDAHNSSVPNNIHDEESPSCDDEESFPPARRSCSSPLSLFDGDLSSLSATRSLPSLADDAPPSPPSRTIIYVSAPSRALKNEPEQESNIPRRSAKRSLAKPTATLRPMTSASLQPMPKTTSSSAPVPAVAAAAVDKHTKKRKAAHGTVADSLAERPTKREKKEKKVVKSEQNETALEWPTMTPTSQINPEFVGKFIGCDREKTCGRWFHYSCLDIRPGDPRLKKGKGKKFLCPFCKAGRPFPAEQAAGGSKEQCGRPGCPVEEEFFEPEAVFGHYVKLHSSEGRKHFWLVFWKGYEWKDVTWEPTSPGTKLVQEFNKRARAEGHDPDDDSVSCILLRAARYAGIANPDD